MSRLKHFARIVMVGVLSSGLIPIWSGAHPVLAAALPAVETIIPVTVFQDDLTNNGNCTLREAVQAVNTAAAVDKCPAGTAPATIQLSAGTYTLSIPGQWENDNQTGDLDFLQNVKIVGKGMDQTRIDGAGLDRVMDVQTGATADLSQLTIQNGKLMTNAMPDEIIQIYNRGGGIRNFGTLTANNIRVTGNLVDDASYGAGGGIYNEGTLTLQDSQISANIAAYLGGGLVSSHNLTLVNVTLQDNVGYGGGAFALTDSGSTASIQGGSVLNSQCGPTNNAVNVDTDVTLNITGTRFANNTLCEDGVISNLGSLTLKNAIFENNTARQGVITNTFGALAMSQTTFNLNTADANGGVLYVTGGTVQMDTSTIERSTGRAILQQGGTINATNATFASNHSSSDASGVEVDGGTMQLESVTLASSQGSSAGLVVKVVGTVKPTVRVHNSLIADNHDLSGGAFDCQVAAGTVISGGYNLIGDGSSCGWTAVTGDQLGSAITAMDVKIGPVGHYDGITETVPLLTGSPAINQGAPTGCPATDQRGIKRPQASRCDIGAYEDNGVQPVILNHSVFLPVLDR